MTTKQLEQLNRRTRIIAALRAGQDYSEIAVTHKATCSYVRKLAREIKPKGGLSECDWAGVMRLAEEVPVVSPPLPKITVRLAEGDGKQIELTIITRWRRGFSETIMSASSGPKDYFKNDIVALFDAHPEIEHIMLVRGQYTTSPPFVLLGTPDVYSERAIYWRDIRGNHVVRCGAKEVSV